MRVRSHFLWLLVIGAYVVVLSMGGVLTPREQPDTVTYVNFPWGSIEAIFSSHRTPVYPALIRAFASPDGQFFLIPYVQLMLHGVAVALLYKVLLEIGLTRVMALSSTLSLMFTRHVLQYAGVLLPELPASSAALIAIAATIRIATIGGSGRWYLVVAMALFASYMLKPLYLFLLALCPLLVVILKAFSGSKGAFRQGVAMVMAAAAPYLLYSAVRAVTVGHFGIVSFGGGNVVGIAAALLDKNDVERLPESYRDFGRDVVSEWQRDDFDQRRTWCNSLQLSRVDIPAWIESQCYDAIVKRVIDPLSMQKFADPVQRNTFLTNFSHAIIQLKTVHYLSWLLWAGLYGLTSLFRWEFLLTAIVTLLVISRLLRAALALGVKSANGSFIDDSAASGTARGIAVLSMCGVFFLLSGLLLVVMVEAPIPRYLNALGTLLVPPLAILSYQELKLWWQTVRLRHRSVEPL